MPLKQRIGLFYHLGPLSKDEIKGYIEHRLMISGRYNVLFTDEAIKCLYRYSGGIPRIINSMATAALLDGFSRDSEVIGELLIEDAARELGLNGYREN
jgi:type II secretory pathway predicted ATPase ExeA